jgi:hypothetical protein
VVVVATRVADLAYAEAVRIIRELVTARQWLEAPCRVLVVLALLLDR